MTRMIILILVMLIATAAADSTGCIYGKILDADDCQPVVGARVWLQETKLGSLADCMDGEYLVKNIPAGIYTVITSCIGYNNFYFDSIYIAPGDSICINVLLKAEYIHITGIIEYFGPPLIDKYETSVIITIDERELEALPTCNLTNILKLKAGIVDSDGSLHIRGSRGDEVAIIDDGVLIRDQLGGH